jgi:hypothetical protein
MERIRIISNTPLVYDIRSEKSAIIVIEIINFIQDPSQQKFHATVVDYVKEDYGLVEICKKTVDYPKPVIDTLFTALNSPILVTDSYFTKTSELLRNGLLLETQMRPVYGSSASNWEVMNDEI